MQQTAAHTQCHSASRSVSRSVSVFFGFGSFDGTGPWPGPERPERCGKDLLFAIICNNFRRRFVSCDRQTDGQTDEFEPSLFEWRPKETTRRRVGFLGPMCRFHLCNAQQKLNTSGSGRTVERFKINEVSRLSGHTFSCPGMVMGCPLCCRVQGHAYAASLSLSPFLRPSCTPSLSDCNLLFRFICQNIFPVPLFR